MRIPMNVDGSGAANEIIVLIWALSIPAVLPFSSVFTFYYDRLSVVRRNSGVRVTCYIE